MTQWLSRSSKKFTHLKFLVIVKEYQPLSLFHCHNHCPLSYLYLVFNTDLHVILFFYDCVNLPLHYFIQPCVCVVVKQQEQYDCKQ
ncbi:hypothetical protein VIGAN_05019200, partial [Vigna angularis var. angularis]